VELLVKERLTGAIILVVLIVLLVPELLSGPKGSPSAPATAPATSSEEPPLRSYTINLDDSHARNAAAGANGPAMPQASGPEQPTSQANGGAANTAADGGTQQPGSQSANTPQTADGGAQSQQPSTTQPPGQSPSAPAPTHTNSSAAQQTKSANNSVKSSRQAATHTTSATSKPASAATAKSAGTATSTSSQKPEGGYAVQLGLFKSKENADRLALEARVKGFKVAVTSSGTGDRKRYRVRVGPAPDRAAAQELQSRLKAAGRPTGTVVPYP
jgi:cell division septation protein DedD